MAVTLAGQGGGFQLSAGVNFSEIDQTTSVPNVSTSTGAIAGVFRWGPIETPTLVTSENELARLFGKPTNLNAETWFSAANFLAYGNALWVSRAANTSLVTANNSYANTGAITNTPNVKNYDDYIVKNASGFDSTIQYIAKYPGARGNSLKVSVVDNANQYASSIDFSNVNSTNSAFGGILTTLGYQGNVAVAVGSNTVTLSLYGQNSPGTNWTNVLLAANAVANAFVTGDFLTIGNNTIGKQSLKITGYTVSLNTNSGTVTTTPGNLSGQPQTNGNFFITFNTDQPNKLSTNYTSNSVSRSWEYSTVVGTAPGKSEYMSQFGNTAANDQMHVVVVDAGGVITGNPGTVLEVFQNLSRATDAKLTNGVSNYYEKVLADQSAYIWQAGDRTGASSNTANNVTNTSNNVPLTLSFVNGSDSGDESTEPFASIARAYDPFANKDRYNIAFILNGKSRGSVNSAQLSNYLIDNIAEVRKDCVVFVSPEYSTVVNNITGQSAQDVVSFRNTVRPSSYAVMDSGYKYQYDKYNDTNRWIPLNADIAGICAYTDLNYDPWWSPAGGSRGQIKNTIKLAYNPSKADRDYLYQNYVNPVVTQQGQGTLLLGDKTLIGKSSAFDRINVRRLFITLEKAISQAAQNSLFEFNDAFTQAQFVNYVTPYLRTVQGRRGIQNFQVVCDATNNTPAVIDANQFVGDIYIQPNRSINYIQLNFVAVSSGVTFSTVTGS